MVAQDPSAALALAAPLAPAAQVAAHVPAVTSALAAVARLRIAASVAHPPVVAAQLPAVAAVLPAVVQADTREVVAKKT